MGIEKVDIYKALEGLDNGSELVSFIKSEFGKVDSAEAQSRILRKEVGELRESMSGVKDILDIVKSENLDANGLRSVIDGKKTTETDLDRALKRIEALETTNRQTAEANDKLRKDGLIDRALLRT